MELPPIKYNKRRFINTGLQPGGWPVNQVKTVSTVFPRRQAVETARLPECLRHPAEAGC